MFLRRIWYFIIDNYDICTIHTNFVVILSDSECSLDCQNGGKCIEETDVYRCRCPEGYLGIYCETEINECDSNPCVHGNCSDMINAFSCNCSAGFVGLHCECTSIAMRYYRPQTKFAKVMFLQVSVCLQGGACVVAPGGGMCGCSGGGACVVAPGGHAWDTTRYGDTINERVVRILLECILVLKCVKLSRFSKVPV